MAAKRGRRSGAKGSAERTAKAGPRWALVTGSAVRVGRAILLAFARAGWNVVVHYRSSESEAERTAREARSLGVEALVVGVDLARASGRERLRDTLEKRDVRLSHLVLSASLFFETPLAAVKEEEWDRIFDVNLKAPFFTLQTLEPLLVDGGGVTFIGDVGADDPWPSFLPYCLTKAGVHAAARGLAKALAPRVRVNAVAPGAILAPKNYGEEEKRRAVERTLLKRWGTPEDVARAVLFLAESPYVTGVILPVDGGKRALA